MEARNGGASAGYSHTAGERKVSYFQTQQQMDVSNIQSAQSTAAQASTTASNAATAAVQAQTTARHGLERRGCGGRRIAERGDSSCCHGC
ncbi:hypothetical protein [Acidithiobacillus ferriphilus]|uniref:hypothetical protein n=1 Tax=Acidithiobacillus ferriphilus TaxID=1689834 RepID=UPI00233085C4|nr:hypothetical protein [Acidithiobacillus ferriphilus]WCE94362.1 hypothetical protein PJU76_02130 [Acidithiobacillus ferriphilus]